MNVHTHSSATRVTWMWTVIALSCLIQSLSATQEYTEWTAWKSTNDTHIQLRSRVQNWGRIISARCEVQFRMTSEGTANFHYDIVYQIDKAVPGGVGRRPGSGWGVRKDSDFAFEPVPDCRNVNDAVITRVVRRSARSGVAQPRQVAGAERNRAEGSPLPVLSGAVRQPRDVINFPGTYRGPVLGRLRSDPDSLTWLHSQSRSLGNRLLNWAPLRTWAIHEPASITQKDWTVLRTLVSRVEPGILRQLAADASRHAERYGSDSQLRQFWTAMARIYLAAAAG